MAETLELYFSGKNMDIQPPVYVLTHEQRQKAIRISAMAWLRHQNHMLSEGLLKAHTVYPYEVEKINEKDEHPRT